MNRLMLASLTKEELQARWERLGFQLVQIYATADECRWEVELVQPGKAPYSLGIGIGPLDAGHAVRMATQDAFEKLSEPLRQKWLAEA